MGLGIEIGRSFDVAPAPKDTPFWRCSSATATFPLRIGTNQTGTNLYDMEFVSAAIFRKALTAAEIATLNNYYQGRVN